LIDQWPIWGRSAKKVKNLFTLSFIRNTGKDRLDLILSSSPCSGSSLKVSRRVAGGEGGGMEEGEGKGGVRGGARRESEGGGKCGG
jgi:hypothetical protein